MTIFLVALISAFIGYWVGFKMGALILLARINKVTNEIQMALDDLKMDLNQWTEDDL
jgi:uncharacterized membrane-anchored protein YhcB (DUF1043 family)